MTSDRSAAHQPGELAAVMLEALDACRQIGPVSERDAAFDLVQAYRVTEAVRERREARGERVVGRKIGFTNTTIWAEYGVYAPIWVTSTTRPLTRSPTGPGRSTPRSWSSRASSPRSFSA